MESRTQLTHTAPPRHLGFRPLHGRPIGLPLPERVPLFAKSELILSFT